MHPEFPPPPLSEPRARPARWKAAVTSALLCGLFMLAYGGTNALAAHRGVTRAMYFEWERLIPFVPLMIVPYMSIDAFFVLAPFLCRSDRELKVLARRVVIGVLVASLCFLVFPLKFSFDRPTTTGWLGAVFDWFRTMDQPFNQLPSLHMTLRTILAVHYAGHLRGWARAASNVWFSLIGFSTVLTYQHHVIDVFGGVLLGAACVYLVPNEPVAIRPVRTPRVGWYYAAAAALAAAGAAALFALARMPWQAAGLLLVYVAVSLGVVAVGYSRFGGDVYRKADGRIHWTARVLLAPVMLAQWLSLKHYARRADRWNEVTDQLWVGRWLNRKDAAALRAAGAVAVLDLTCEFDGCGRREGLAYLNVPVLDLTRPTRADLDQAVAFIDAHADRGPVYVHCKAGFSRSAAVAGAYLIRRGIARGAAEAAHLLRAKRPGIVLRPEVLDVLAEEADRAGGLSDGGRRDR